MADRDITDLKALRASIGMTQKQFADHFEVPMRTLQHWESGDRQCPEYLLKLMQYKIKKEKEQGI